MTQRFALMSLAVGILLMPRCSADHNHAESGNDTTAPADATPDTDVRTEDSLLLDCADAESIAPSDTDSVPEQVDLPEQVGLGEPCLEVTPSEIHFGGQKWGELAAFPLIIRNCSEDQGTLKIYGIQMKAGHGMSPDFAVDLSMLDHQPTPDNPFILPAGTSVTIHVTYSPDAVNPLQEDGSFILDQGILLIDSNSFEESTETPMDGAGVDETCPLAVIQCTEGSDVIPQTLLHLVGSQSSAFPLAVSKWEWAVTQPPLSASVFIPSYNYPDPTFEANAAGVYTFTLNVWDSMGNKSCTPASYEVTVTPDQAIHVELLWHTPGDYDETDTGPDAGSDLDLHFAHPGADRPDCDGDGQPDPWFDDFFDCFWFNEQPDWGSPQPNINDNPSLDRCDTDGAGPENLNLAIPENVDYRIGVHYWNEKGYGSSYATVRVYIYGILVFQIKDVLLQDQDMWEVATIAWPAGQVTQIQGASGPYRVTSGYCNPFIDP